MRYWICLVFLLVSSMHAEEKSPLGAGATSSSKEAAYTQNWVFAGIALAGAVLGIVVVGLDSGKTSSSQE